MAQSRISQEKGGACHAARKSTAPGRVIFFIPSVAQEVGVTHVRLLGPLSSFFVETEVGVLSVTLFPVW